MRNLQEIIPAFFVGPGGQRLTPEQIAQREEVAKSLMAQATDTSPNAGGWASIASKGLMGFAAGRNRNAAERASTANAEANSSLSSSLLGSLLSPSTPSTGGGWSGMAPTADVAPSPSVASALMQSPQMAANQPPVPGLQPAVTDLATGIQQSAAALGIDPVDLATVISYETGGTFDPLQKGPTTKWGQHKGLIQFGEPQAQEYGVDWNNPLGSQLGPEGAVVKYLRSNGVTPGMSLLDVYSTINAGAPGLYDRSDAAAGGAPGTVRDKVENQMGGHRAKAMALFAPREETGATGAVNAMAQGGQMPMPEAAYVDPMVSAPNSRVAPTPSVEVAQALTPQPNAGYFPPVPQAGGLDPAVIQALSDPNVSPQNKQIAMTLVEQYQSRQQAAQEQAQKLALQQQELERRRSIAQAQGFDPALAEEEIAYKAAVEAASRGRQTQTVNGKVIDVNTGEVVFEAAQPDPTSVQEYNFYAQQMQANGQQPMDYNSWSLQKAGAGAQTNIGSIPAGMMLERDGASMRLVPIPGGPADVEAQKLAAAETRKGGQTETASSVVTNAASRALEAMNAEGMPATGVVGAAMSYLPESNAAEVRRQVDVLKANATVSNLTAMREASPTGGALGSVTEKEGAMLAAKSGSLDPNSPNFERDLKDYTKTMLEIIHGPQAGREIFNSMQWGASKAERSEDGWTDVGGVKIRPKGGN